MIEAVAELSALVTKRVSANHDFMLGGAAIYHVKGDMLAYSQLDRSGVNLNSVSRMVSSGLTGSSVGVTAGSGVVAGPQTANITATRAKYVGTPYRFLNDLTALLLTLNTFQSYSNVIGGPAQKYQRADQARPSPS